MDDGPFLEMMIGRVKDDTVGREAGFWIRIVAFLIDQVLIGIILSALGTIGVIAFAVGIQFTGDEYMFDQILAFSILYSLVSGVFWASYYIYFTGLSGQTLGKKIFRLRVVRENGLPMNYAIAFLRLIGYAVCFLTFGLGFFLIAVDSRKRGLHDRMAGTIVIETP